MLPLASNTRPTLSGASSLENWVIVCSTFSSVSLKCSFSRPVTNRFIGSVTVTLIRTSCVSTRILVSRRAAGSSGSLRRADSRLDIDAGFRSAGWTAYLSFSSAASERNAVSEEKAGKRVQQKGFHDHISDVVADVTLSSITTGDFHAMIERAYPNSGGYSSQVRVVPLPR